MWSIIGMAVDGCIHCPKVYLFFYLMCCRLWFPCPADLLKILNGPRCPLGIYICLLWTLWANACILGPPGNYLFRMQGVVLPWHRGRGEQVPTWPCHQDSWLPEQAPGFRDHNDTFFHSIVHCFHTHNFAPLMKLRLTNTGLTVTEWMSFLKDLHLKHLRILEVEALCPVQGLVNFLSCHELDTLVISSLASIADRLCPHLSPSQHTQRSRCPWLDWKVVLPTSFLCCIMLTSPTTSNTLGYGLGNQASVTFSSQMSCLAQNISLHCKTFLCTFLLEWILMPWLAQCTFNHVSSNT